MKCQLSALSWAFALVLSVVARTAAEQPPSAGTAVHRMERGQAIYRTHCARCHGEDGADTTTYVGAKSLVDITQRMTAEGIIARSSGFVTARLEGADAAALVAYLGSFRAGGYANPELLVETEWVALHANDRDVRLVDMRRAATYAAGHIPGAVRIDEDPLRDREDRLTYLPSPATVEAMLVAAGITNDTHVVIYDDQGGRMAARLWYVLSACGHERISLVNGGWNKWVAEQRPVSTETPKIAPGRFVAKRIPALSCPAPELLARKPGVVVLDTRSPSEYRGEQVSGGASKAGRVPGAVHVEWKENVTGPNLVFKPAAELRKLYESRGVKPDQEIVTYCASGGRAAQSLFTLKLLGYPKVRLYYGSFSDYTSRPDAPIEKP